MKSRFATGLLAALLAMVANFGVPAARIAFCRAVDDIAWVENARRAQPDISEPRVIAPPVRPRNASAIPQDDPPVATSILDQSLFQRPPPPALLSRS